MSSILWKKDNYINENIIYLFNREIIEYDMKEAGFSLIKEFKLITNDEIQKLKALGKKERTIKIGKLQAKNSKLRDNLKEAFQNARKLFFELNDIKDEDILSIKKDAIFVTKYCSYTKIGDFIEFRPKHIYSSYIRLGKRLEFYYNPDELDVKGIGEENLKYHTNYMLNFINLYFKKMETSDKASVIEFTRNFIDKYKARELDIGYYRNFNSTSDFTIYDDSNQYMNYWEDEKDQIDITYNYFNILLQLIKIPL